MKKILLLVWCAVVVSAATVWAAPADPKDEKAVMATLEAMAKATIAKDVAALSKIYSDDITYSHSSAQNQNKAEVLGHAAVIHDDLKTADAEFDIFQNLTTADVQRAAKTYFTPENRLVLTIMPRGAK